MKHLWYGLMISLTLLSCGKKAPTDDQLKDFCRNVGFAINELNDSTEQSNTFLKAAKKSEASYDIRKITPEQIDLLFEDGGSALDMHLRKWLSPILKQKAEKEGTIYAYYYWKYYPADIYNPVRPADEVEVFKTLLSKDDLSTFIEQTPEAGKEIVTEAARINAKQWTEFGMIPYVKSLLTYPLSNQAIEKTVQIFNTAFVGEISQADKEEIRKQVLSLYEKLAKETTTPSQKKRAEAQIAYLQSAFATGTLVGNKAPELHFQWISNGKEKTLDDFKGKVVMLDFWATKCGPCVKSFPEMAKLQEHYRNSNVAIIGVTSVQGYFVDTPNGKVVNTENDPKKEMSLMPAYMKGMGINWRIAFTEEDVMNVEYGVLAIPHITLIDKEGKVRYNNITGTNEEKIKLIDSLLNE